MGLLIKGQWQNQWNVMAGGSIIVALPPLLFFFFWALVPSLFLLAFTFCCIVFGFADAYRGRKTQGRFWSSIYCYNRGKPSKQVIGDFLLIAVPFWFLYGSMVWGILPIRPQMSWELHLAGAVLGSRGAVPLFDLDAVASPEQGFRFHREQTIPLGEDLLLLGKIAAAG